MMKDDKKSIEALLDEPSNHKWSKKRKTLAVSISLIILAVGVWWLSSSKPAPRYLTEKVVRGNLTVNVTANGTLEAEQTVSIGSELSGIVEKVFVDVNDVVSKDNVLIELDTTKLQASVARAKAALSSAIAGHKEAEATHKEAKAKYHRLLNVRKLSGGKTPAQTEIDEQAAVVARAQASIETAKAKIENAQADLTTAETDLTKAYISAPIDGVILARSVEPGYAVAASLQAVELLTLASDLRELELEVDVDEADVAVVQAGQHATFTVSAYPNRQFPAKLTKVAYGPSQDKDSNVVTYTAYLTVKNQDLLLRPGMTATALIETKSRENVLLVPNTALRYKPTQNKTEKSAVSGFMMGPPHKQGVDKKATDSGGASTVRQNRIWVLRNNQPTLVPIVTGATDGIRTEVISGELKEGDLLITGQLKLRE